MLRQCRIRITALQHAPAGQKSLYTGQSVERVAANPQKAVFSFRSTLNNQEGEGRSPDQSWQREPAA
jgi:hypothetical protein